MLLRIHRVLKANSKPASFFSLQDAQPVPRRPKNIDFVTLKVMANLMAFRKKPWPRLRKCICSFNDQKRFNDQKQDQSSFSSDNNKFLTRLGSLRPKKYYLGQSKTFQTGAQTYSALKFRVPFANQQTLNLLMIAKLLPQKLFMDFQYFLFIIIEEHSKRRAMSDYNLHQMRDLDSYGDHLFCLDQKYLSFWTEEPQVIENHLQTKISNSGPEAAQEKGKIKKAEVGWTDEHFEMGFMKEHKFILQKYIRNHMRLFQAQSEGKPDHQNIHQSPKEVYPLQKAFQAIQEDEINYPQGQKCSIDEQILRNPKIVAFLNVVLEEFQPLVSLTLLKLFKILWGEYMNKEDKKIGEREIIEFTNRLMTSAFLKRMLLVMPNKGKGIALTTMKEFLNVIANTLFFVGCEFFLNPYYQLQEELIVKEFHNYELFMYDSCIIDQQAQEEHQCEGKKGRKLVKLDHSHEG